MKPATKLALRRRVLMTLRAILWHADEWLHRQELALREDLERVAEARAEIHSPKAGSTPAARSKTETFQQWEARRSGVIITDGCKARGKTTPLKGLIRRQRGVPAAEFDLRFAR